MRLILQVIGNDLFVGVLLEVEKLFEIWDLQAVPLALLWSIALRDFS